MVDRAVTDGDDPQSGGGLPQRSACRPGYDHRDAPIFRSCIVVQMSREDGIHAGLFEQPEIIPADLRCKRGVSFGFVDSFQEKGMVCEKNRDFVIPFPGERFFEPPELSFRNCGIRGSVFEITGIDPRQQDVLYPDVEAVCSQMPFVGGRIDGSIYDMHVVVSRDVRRTDSGVDSGDDPQAVSHVAAQAGIAHAEQWVDAASLHSDAALEDAARQCTVFGRVTPEQKRKLVHALQNQGHTVAMTGDGVNDVLALKDADCGIAMASGAQAASQVAQLVLLDSDFGALPDVVAEGRRVINNIQRSASLFLVKNIFSLLLSLAALCLPLAYPFQPLQLSLLSAVTIGLPSFVLALEPNYEMVRGKFIHNVLHAALPGGLTDFLLVFCAQGFAYAFDLPADALGTISTLLTLETGLIVLFQVCDPFTPLRWTLWGSCTILGLGGAVLFSPWLELVPLDLGSTLVLVVLAALVLPVLRTATHLVDQLWKAGRRLSRQKKKA